MEIFLILYLIGLFVWAINAFSSINKAGKVCDKSMDANLFSTDIHEIYEYHSAFNYKNWFGFRHWFFPYKIIGEDK